VLVTVSIANVAILTRFLSPTEYGRLALLLVFSSFITVLCNLGSLQGSFSAGFGSQEGPAVEEIPTEGDDSLLRRRGLGTGIVLTSGLGVLAFALSAAAAHPLAAVLVGDRARSAAVIWSAAAGSLGSVWRLSSNILRLERRPVGYVIVRALRPTVSLGTAIPLLFVGQGISGVMEGYTLGTAVSLGAGLVAARRSYRVSFSWAHVRSIMRYGSTMVPVVIFFWVMESADVFILSRFSSHREVGLYRVSSRVSALTANLGSAFMMAWGPILREPIFAAAERETGMTALNRAVTTYFAAILVWAALALAAFDQLLVKIAPNAYSTAAALIPLLALRWISKLFFQVTYRTAQFETKRRAFSRLAIVSMMVFLAVSVAVIPFMGAYGAALACAVSPLPGAAGMLWRSRRQGEDCQFDVPRIARIFVLAGAALGVALLSRAYPSYGIELELLGTASFPFLLFACGVIPRSHLTSVIRFARSELLGRATKGELRARLAYLKTEDRAIVSRLLADRADPPAVANELGLTEPAVLTRFVGVLRLLAATGEPTSTDPALGAYLIWKGTPATGDDLCRQLWMKGIDPLEIHILGSLVRRLRSEPRRTWEGLPVPERQAV
jgi:O-antigen/teichoic acid export membrane protein